MTEIKYSKKGTTWAIEIQGDSKQEITERFWSFWNHGATDGEFHWLNEFRGYFWTDEKRFSKSLENIFLFKMLNEADELREKDVTGVYSTKRHGASTAIAISGLGQGDTDDATDFS